MRVYNRIKQKMNSNIYFLVFLVFLLFLKGVESKKSSNLRLLNSQNEQFKSKKRVECEQDCFFSSRKEQFEKCKQQCTELQDASINESVMILLLQIFAFPFIACVLITLYLSTKGSKTDYEKAMKQVESIHQRIISQDSFKKEFSLKQKLIEKGFKYSMVSQNFRIHLNSRTESMKVKDFTMSKIDDFYTKVCCSGQLGEDVFTGQGFLLCKEEGVFFWVLIQILDSGSWDRKKSTDFLLLDSATWNENQIEGRWENYKGASRVAGKWVLSHNNNSPNIHQVKRNNTKQPRWSIS